MRNSIAAILTVHNRKAKTLKCLESLFSITQEIDVYLTDDGCTDGTSEEIKSCFPQVHIIHGDGNLFWTRGMNKAWEAALVGNYQYYLWLNDDVELYPFFLQELIDCEQMGGGECIVCGAVEDITEHRLIYGGRDKSGDMVMNITRPQEIIFMNGNIVLVPRAIVNEIGIMDGHYHHDLGDVDYALTARERGFNVYTTRRAIATGYPNGICRVRKWNTTMVNRFKKLSSPLGSPLAINYYFRKKHYGIINAVLFNIRLVLLNILSDKLIRLIYGNRYIDKQA